MIDNINVSQPDDHNGDVLRDAFIKVNDNFDYVLSLISSGVTSGDLSNAISDINIDLEDLQRQINLKMDANASIPLERIIGLVNALGRKVNTSVFNETTGRINDAISEILALIADLQFQIGDISPIHNELEGLQGGDMNTSEFYHLTLSQLQRVLSFIYQNSTATLSNSPTTGERGLSTNVSLTYNIASNDDVITSASINQGIGSVLSGVNQGVRNINAGNFVNNVTFTLSLGYTRNGVPTSETRNSSYTTNLPQWSGISNLTNLNTANYNAISAALQKVVQGSSTISRSLQPNNQYVWFVSTNANASITNNGFPTIIGEWNSTTAFFIKQTVSLTLADGTSVGSLTFYRTRQTATLTTAQNFTIS